MAIQKRNRRVITDQDTFDYSSKDLRISTSEANGYFERNPKTNQFVQALGLIPEFAKTAEQVLNYQNQKDEEKGIAARQSGDLEIEEKSKAYLKGWDKVDGQAKSVEFGIASEEYFEQNKDKSPSEFKEGYDALIQSYVDGRSKEFLGAFFPNALNVQANVESNIQKHQIGILKENEQAPVRTVLNNALQQSFLKAFNEVNKTNITSLQEVSTNYKLMQAYQKNKVIIDAKTGIYFSKADQENKKQFKELGMITSTKELSVLSVNLASQMSRETGINLLSFIHEKGTDGISIANSSLGNDAVNEELSAKDHSIKVSENLEQEFKETQRDNGNYFTASFLKKTTGMTDAQARKEALNWVKKLESEKNNMDSESYTNNMAMLERIANPEEKDAGKTAKDYPYLDAWYTQRAMGKIDIGFFQRNLGRMKLEEKAMISGELEQLLSSRQRASEGKPVLQGNLNDYYGGANNQLEKVIIEKYKNLIGVKLDKEFTYNKLPAVRQEYARQLKMLYDSRAAKGVPISFEDYQRFETDFIKQMDSVFKIDPITKREAAKFKTINPAEYLPSRLKNAVPTYLPEFGTYVWATFDKKGRIINSETMVKKTSVNKTAPKPAPKPSIKATPKPTPKPKETKKK